MTTEELQAGMLKELDEMVEYYKSNPRGIKSNGHCAYYAERNEGYTCCAVGRKLPVERAKFIQDEFNDSSIGVGTLYESIADILVYPKTFWAAMQRFHDIHNHWDTNPDNENGQILSPDGVRFYNGIKEGIVVNKYN